MLMVTKPERWKIEVDALAEAAREEERRAWLRLTPSVDRRKWYMLCILQQAENAISGTLVGLKIANVYSPSVFKEQNVYARNSLSGRKTVIGRKRVRSPMFPGYMFARFDYDVEWPKIRARVPSERARTFDRVDGSPYVVHDFLMQAIYQGEITESKKTVGSSAFTVGQAVRTLAGPFSDFIGKIERLDSCDRIRILLDLFGRETQVVLPAHEIEAV